MQSKIRVVLFTIEDTEFVPSLLGPVLADWSPSIIRVFVTKTFYGSAFFRKKLPYLIRNGYPFCIRPSDLFRLTLIPLRGLFGRKTGPKSILQFLKQHNLQAEYLEEIRSEATLKMLAELNANVFLLCPFDKIAGPRFLAIPKLGAFNVHLGKLPQHRGALSAFWVLRFGDTEAGGTVHRAVKKIDGGDIIAESRILVKTRSMQELMRETFEATGPVVSEALRKLADGAWEPIDTSGRPEGYYWLPSWEDFREFYSRGCRLI